MYEVEIKSLLGGRERAEELKSRLHKRSPAFIASPLHKQLNHYFNEPEDAAILLGVIGPLLSPERREKLSAIIANAAGGASIRTREADGEVFFVLKASVGDDTSANGVSRIEFEEPVKLSLEALDKKLLDAGCTCQAKWSRERESYRLGEIVVTVDKNAGYGYLAEFEKMAESVDEASLARAELAALMAEFGCTELPQERLERMFKFYNEHWREYYGTDKTFVVE